MSVTLNPYLNFKGNCREAFTFYAKCLGGEIVYAKTFAESPMADQVPAERQQQLVHVRLEAPGVVLMGSDCPNEVYEAPQGTILALHPDSVSLATALFRELSEGGQIRMPFEETFWAECFGMCIDRFGVPWMVNYPGNKTVGSA
ncbi:MAG: glyoxalase/bleomycin resistance/extradiol dioxygenase family protein [Alcanivorax sp.]|nr:glyoxalase/bleomycin resistance/extradiol dioxygenase family protein [Alcanivorax sp.]